VASVRAGIALGEIDAALVEAEAAAGGLPLVVAVLAALQPLPRLDDAEDRPLDPDGVERIRYLASDGSLHLVKRETPSRLMPLQAQETAQSIGERSPPSMASTGPGWRS
jgi:hypothetical protein